MFRYLYGVLFVVLLPALCGAATVHILATGDLHGYLKGRPMDGYQQGGAAAMLAYWKQREEFAPGKFLVVSSGDNVTGTPISTMLEGEADIEVMNAMGFQASALGNYEFNFGRGQLLRLEAQATFPFLAANLYNPDGSRAEVAKPYALIESQGVKVAVIGLAHQSLQSVPNIGIFKVGPYDEALRRAAAEVRAKGAQVIIVVAQLSVAELATLARAVPELRIPVMFGGFTHELGQQYVPDTDTWVMANGSRWAAYSRVDLEVDALDGSARVVNSKQVWLSQRAPAVDPAVTAIIDRWQQKLGPDFNKPLGGTVTGLLRSSTTCAFAMQSWLAADSTADFAMINMGGCRQDLAPGTITKADIIASLPFDNSVYRIKITGQQLLNFRGPKGELVATSGLRMMDGKLCWSRMDQPIDVNATYKLLVNDYLYNNCEALKQADPAPATAFPDWRIPVYRWLADHKTSAQRPLEKETTLNKIIRFGEAGMVN